MMKQSTTALLQPGELAGEVGAGGGLPLLAPVRRVEQLLAAGQVVQHGHPARLEVRVGDVGVVATDARDVVVVPLRAGGQDRQVGVAQSPAGLVVGGGVVGLG